ncbi:nucleotidyltransferase domain-containing protein [Bacillus salacetis]|uniref:nucleotidyltransferase domain-containing protein n=1 Tax=Bacillus salacetis TaxID=2315464 RepID=UPI003BA2C499
MRTDYENWEPLSAAEASKLFSHLPVFWAIAGGWALDLHIGKQTREHGDIDIIIWQKDLPRLYEHFSQNWMLYKAGGGKLHVWEEGDLSEEINNVWVSRTPASPFAFQVLVLDFEGDTWVYRRQQTIKRRDILLKTKEGLPYLRPEIQLLYKGGSSHVREKDHADLREVLPFLTIGEKEWLRTALLTQFPGGHPWADSILKQESEEQSRITHQDKK